MEFLDFLGWVWYNKVVDKIKNLWYDPKYDLVLNETGYCDLGAMDAVTDAFRARTNLIDVRWGGCDHTADDAKIIGTVGMYKCIGLGVTADAGDKRHRFVAHTFPFMTSCRSNLDDMDRFLDEIGAIDKVSACLSTTRSYTDPSFNADEYEWTVIKRLRASLGAGSVVPLFRSFALEIGADGGVKTDGRFVPHTVVL